MFISFSGSFSLWSTRWCQQPPELCSSVFISTRKKKVSIPGTSCTLGTLEEAGLSLKTQRKSLIGLHTHLWTNLPQGIGILCFLWAIQAHSWGWTQSFPTPGLSPSQEVREVGNDAEKQPINVFYFLPFCPCFSLSPSFLLSSMANSVPRYKLQTWKDISCPWGPLGLLRKWHVTNESNIYSYGRMLIIERWEYRGRRRTELLAWGEHRGLCRTVNTWVDFEDWVRGSQTVERRHGILIRGSRKC